MKCSRGFNFFAAILLGVGAVACDLAEPAEVRLELTGGEALAPLTAEAAFSCDFNVSSDTPMEEIPPVIERDRMFMADQPGLSHGKHLPISPDMETGDLRSGGRYLFDTDEDADSYRHWVTEGYRLGGVGFLERPFISNPDCRTWSLVFAYDRGGFEADVVMRTERFHVPSTKPNPRLYLMSIEDELVAEAEARGLTGLWAIYNHRDQLAEFVYMLDGSEDADASPGHFDRWVELQLMPGLGDQFADEAWSKVFDRSHLLLSIWFPFVPGDQGRASLWPNSPPMPAPSCGDGVCSVSQGQNHDTCPADCPLNCGDAICQEDEGESIWNCPGDCRL
jgi:hypothetical protein